MNKATNNTWKGKNPLIRTYQMANKQLLNTIQQYTSKTILPKVPPPQCSSTTYEKSTHPETTYPKTNVPIPNPRADRIETGKTTAHHHQTANTKKTPKHPKLKIIIPRLKTANYPKTEKNSPPIGNAALTQRMTDSQGNSGEFHLQKGTSIINTANFRYKVHPQPTVIDTDITHKPPRYKKRRTSPSP
jgi:hypothetical protein